MRTVMIQSNWLSLVCWCVAVTACAPLIDFDSLSRPKGQGHAGAAGYSTASGTAGHPLAGAKGALGAAGSTSELAGSRGMVEGAGTAGNPNASMAGSSTVLAVGADAGTTSGDSSGAMGVNAGGLAPDVGVVGAGGAASSNGGPSGGAQSSRVSFPTTELGGAPNTSSTGTGGTSPMTQPPLGGAPATTTTQSSSGGTPATTTAGSGGVAGASSSDPASSGGAAPIAGAAGGPVCPTAGARMVQIPVGFCIDSTEVTRRQYAAWLKTNPEPAHQVPSFCAGNSSFEPDAICLGGSRVCTSNCDEHPQICVDWCDAYAYCLALGKRLCGRIGGGSNGYDDFADPNTSQWQYACSASGRYLYAYGDDYRSTACNGLDDGIDTTVPVATMPACHSPLAPFADIYDLNGNVLEWEDACGDAPDPGDHDAMKLFCRIRGGNFRGDDTHTTCAADWMEKPQGAFWAGVGFRCCAH